MIVDGRVIAADILQETKARVEKLGRVPVVRAITANPSPATLSYLNIKALRAADAGMVLEVVALPATATEEDYMEAIRATGADAVIVQLPLPVQVNVARVVNAISVSTDADVLSGSATELFEHDAAGALLPPVVSALKEVLERTGVMVAGSHAVVVGQGKLVGRPAAYWLSRQGALVQVLTKESYDQEAVASAEILVLGVGSPGLIKDTDIAEGVVLIDAGTSEQGGQVVGDADPACANKASVFTPVPGGMGPIAVACLFRNVATLLERSLQEN